MTRWAVASVVLLALIGAQPASAATHPLAAVADAYVDAGAPASTFGTSVDLDVATTTDPTRVAYLTFDLAALLGRRASSATLTLTTRHATPGATVTVDQVTGSFDESTVTWTTAPALGAPLATSGPLADGQSFSVTIPGRTIPRSGQVTLALVAAPGSSASLRSRESPQLAPQLTVLAANVPARGPLHTDGAVIRNAKGKIVHLAGFQVTGLAEGHGNAWPAVDHCGQGWRIPPGNDLDADRLTLDGFNTVRLAISWANLEPTPPTLDESGNLVHHWDENYLQTLEQMVTAYTGRGDYVILDMAQSQWSPAFKRFTVAGRDFVCEGMGLPGWLYPNVLPGTPPGASKCDFFNDVDETGGTVPELPQEGMAAAWQVLAQRFAPNTGVVAADLLSEPGWPPPAGAQACADTPTSDDLIAFFHRVGDAIQGANPNLMPIFEDGTWANYVVRGFTLTSNPGLSNSIYSWHYYPDAPGAAGGMQALQEHVARAREWNVPFYMGEFNAYNEAMNGAAAHTDEASWEADTQALMAYAKANNVEWTMWQWRVGGGGSLIDPDTGAEKQPLLAVLQSGI